MPSLSGFIRTESGAPALNATVKGFDKDLRHEQLLGEIVIKDTSGRYQIDYTADKFRRAEKRTADLIVRAWDEEGNLRAESEVLFNAPETATINLTFGPLKTSELSEYERLVHTLEPVLEDVEPADLSQSDIAFLIGETRQPRQNIEFLRTSAALTRETNIPTEAFYGWARRNLPLDLDRLLRESFDRLSRELTTAIRDRIIPDISKRFAEIAARFAALQIQRGVLVRHDFAIALLDQQSGEPLAGYTVKALDLDAGPQPVELPDELTDGQGLAVITYYEMRPGPQDTAPLGRRLQLTIIGPSDQVIERIRISAPGEKSPQEVRVRIPPEPDTSPRIEALGLPSSLAMSLRQKSIATLADLRRAGGALRVDGLDRDDPDVKRLEAHVRLSTLSADVKDHAVLVEKGFDSPLKIANAPRSEFVRAASALGDFKAAQLHAGARAQVMFLNTAITGFRATPPNGDTPPGFLPNLGKIIEEEPACHCEDCEAAVSPAAYLAELLDYAITHVKLRTNGNPPEFETINLDWLEDNLHQSFGDLPASCEAVGERVRQVRICCEVLRHLIAEQDAEPSIRTRIYLDAAYLALLAQIGTSYQELRETVLFGNNEQRALLADRLGILSAHLEVLFDDIEAPTLKRKVNEPWLEQHFGLVSTIRDPLVKGDTPLLVVWRLEYLRKIWADLDFPTDAYSDQTLPFIDPDLIGPDDFRRPQSGQPAFDLWQQRRTFVDNRITHCHDILTDRGFNSLIRDVYPGSVPDLSALRDQLTKGDAPAKTKAQVQKLGLTMESLLRLADIQDKAETGVTLTAEEITDTVNILTQVEKQRQIPAWISEEEESEIQLDLRVFWSSLREPEEGDWPPTPTPDIPLIDPETLEREDLTEPTIGAAALALWQARTEQLEQDYEEIKQARETDGFDAMLRVALGHPIAGNPLQHDLDQLQANLADLDQTVVDSAKETITNDLRMTVEDFSFLMLVRTKSANSETSQQPTAEEWNKTYGVLNTAHKQKHTYPVWLTQETQPDLSPYWKILKARLPRWRASFEARQTWQQTLMMRSQPPLIDPDLLEPNDIVKTEITEPPYSLWKARTIWVKDRLAEVRTLRESAATSLAGLGAVLTDEAALEMPVVGLDVAELLALEDQRQQGEPITSRLQQLTLENNGFNYLLQIIDKTEGDVDLTDGEWHAVDSIVVQTAKRRLFGEWRREEQAAGLHIGQDFFHPPDKTSKLLPEWRATKQARRLWENTLQSRVDQAQTAINSLQEAVSAVEEETLVRLRDALIDPLDEGNTRLEKAKWITDHLLIEASGSGCQITTRISQAIETVQNLLWSIRTGQLRDSRPDWILDADNFDEEWKWIGSYATWRAAMFVFLYPENIAIPSLRRWQTPPFKRLVDTTRNQRLTPDSACGIADQHADYFKDVCELSLEASCYARTRVHDGDGCRKKASVEYRRLYYLFARSKTSKHVYWSTYDFTNHSGYAQTFWDAVPGLEGATKIIGAVPFDDFVFVFALVKVPAGSNALVVTRYDLSSNRWDESPQEIEPPGTESSFKIPVVVQRTLDASPPALIIQGHQNTYYRTFTQEDLSGAGQAEGEEDNGDEEAVDQWKQLDALAEQNLFMEKELSSGGTVHNGKVVAAIALEQGVCIFANYFGKVALAHTFNHSWQEQDFVQYDVGKWQGALIWDQADGDTRLYAFVDDTYTPLRITNDLQLDFDPHIPAPFLKGGRVTVHCDDERVGAQTFSPIAYSTNQGDLYLATFRRTPDSGVITSTKPPFPIAPKISGPPLAFSIGANLTDTERVIRWVLIGQIFITQKNLFAPESIMTYLREAYFFVPMHLALQLQQAGHYTVALDWFRTVYDFSQSASQRKIYYGLTAEESFSDGFERTSDWLLDPLNPHLIAATRANTYTRFTLLSIIRCLLDYADDEFTRDTAESVPRARTLYLTALELLNTKDLKQTTNACDQLIGSLQIEVGDSWKKTLEVVLAELNTFDTAANVGEVTNTIKALASDTTLDDEQKVFRITSAIAAAKARTARPQTIAKLTGAGKEKAATVQTALLADPLIFKAATESANITRMHFVEGMASVTGLSPTELEAGQGDLTWLREPISVITDDLKLNTLPNTNNGPSLGFAAEVRSIPGIALNTTFGIGQDYSPAPSFGFCIPPNPLLNSLRMRAELNLFKLRECRNIAGVVRELEPYAAATDTFSGMPVIGAGGQLALPGLFVLKPTPYRYKVLIERAKELVQLAAQIEGAMLAALEKRDAEAYQVLKARQELNLARAGIQLQSLRLREARNSVTLAELQRDRAEIQFETYQDWIDTGIIESEQALLNAYIEVRETQLALSRFSTATQIANAAVTAATADYSAALAWSFFAGFTGLAIGESTAREFNIRAETAVQMASFQSSFERRQQEWELQKTLAEQDVKIGVQQIQLANDHVDIVDQEREIAVMQLAHANETVDFLLNKFTNVELYDWMSNVLESVYSFFLERATGMAKVAENQLAFERQEITPAFIKSDYWETADANSSMGATTSAVDRRGLTGSARLLQDVYQLDQYAFESDRPKLQLTRAISIASISPLELQRFRETGVIVFATPMELFDRDFPGHYLRLIKQVRTSVIALIPPSHGIKATLSTTGTSRVVIGGGLFQTVSVSRGPESVALSSPSNATGIFELNPQPELLLPFEGIGVDTTWEFRMPKASNFFDYGTIADVLISIDYTALNSFDYHQQVIQQLDPSISADRAYSFRHEFADAWYDLNNPDQTGTPMVVRFGTRREDFPPNLEDVRIQHVALYFARKSGASFEVPVSHLRFREQASPGPVGGGAMSIDGIISTRRGNAGSWTPIIGKTPSGEWEFALPNAEEMRNRFTNEEIEDILFVLTYSGLNPITSML
jgi:Tc toxin complex TcA C-terminal TcB-binding domain